MRGGALGPGRFSHPRRGPSRRRRQTEPPARRARSRGGPPERCAPGALAYSPAALSCSSASARSSVSRAPKRTSHACGVFVSIAVSSASIAAVKEVTEVSRPSGRLATPSVPRKVTETPAAALGARQGQGRRAGGARGVAQDQVGQVRCAAYGRDRLDVAEDGEQHRQGVRAHVPQAALLAAPRRFGARVRVAAVQAAEPLRAPGDPAVPPGEVREPLGGRRGEAHGREDDRGDARARGGVGEGASRRGIRGDGLVEEEVAARLGGTRRERGLDVRREGEGEGVARFEEFREAVLAAVGGDAVRGGECGGGLGPAAPDPGERRPRGARRARGRGCARPRNRSRRGRCVGCSWEQSAPAPPALTRGPGECRGVLRVRTGARALTLAVRTGRGRAPPSRPEPREAGRWRSRSG
ncbi:hypothetical protein GA0115252_10321, partial [Streptomyces sp. DfronAA-171]